MSREQASTSSKKATSGHKYESTEISADDLAKGKVEEIEVILNSKDGNLVDLETLNSWLSILKQIVTAADLHRTNDDNKGDEDSQYRVQHGDSIYADYDDDNEQFHAADFSDHFASNPVKWTIRVRAFKVVHRVLNVLLTHKDAKNKVPILRHLPDLVRLAFVAATSPYDDLIVQGFELFKFIIENFALVEEREFPGQSILDQYRTQVLSALKPAFNLDAPPYITAIAVQVCCLWICKGLDKSKLTEFMSSSLDKLENQSTNQNSKLYTESELEQERLDILGSWAQLYIVSEESKKTLKVSRDKEPSSCKSTDHWTDLSKMVDSKIDIIIDKWWEALKDYALLILPSPKFLSAAHDNQHVYTREVALKQFSPIWPKLILAATYWLCTKQTKYSSTKDVQQVKESCDDKISFVTGPKLTRYFRFICGIAMKEICRFNQEIKLNQEASFESVSYVLKSLVLLLNEDLQIPEFDMALPIIQEFHSAIYSLVMSRLHYRDQNRKTIKALVDRLFEMGAFKVSKESRFILNGLSTLNSMLSEDIKNLNRAYDDRDPDRKTLKTLDVSIRMNSIVALLKFEPKLHNTDLQLFNSLIDTFKIVVNFPKDHTLGIGFIKLMHVRLSPEFVIAINKAIYNTTLLTSCDIMKSLQTNIVPDKDLASRSMSYLDAYHSLNKQFFNLLCNNERPNFIVTYVKSLLSVTFISSFNIESLTPHQKDIILLSVKYCDDLKNSFKVEFKQSMDAETEDILNKLYQTLRDIRAKEETKRASQVTKKPATSKPGPSKQPAKITLKADFSNFYSNK